MLNNKETTKAKRKSAKKSSKNKANEFQPPDPILSTYQNLITDDEIPIE